MAHLQACGDTKNPIRVREVNNIVDLLTLMLVPPYTCRGASDLILGSLGNTNKVEMKSQLNEIVLFK